jgi:probable DNA metabolism protein
MRDYLYDGSWEGFLTCIYHHYYQEPAHDIHPASTYQHTFISSATQVETNEDNAEKVYHAIEQKFSGYDQIRLYRGFLSSDPEKEKILLDYLVLGFQKGSSIGMHHGHPVVARFAKMEKKVSFEVHRLQGLVRFSQMTGDVLYAPITPDHDVTQLLAHHFCDRFSQENFIIHDTRRNKALLSSQGEYVISAFAPEDLPPLSQEENQVRALWKTYFETIAIKERTNRKCQRNFMPVRYWQHLTEITTPLGESPLEAWENTLPSNPLIPDSD